MIYLLQNIHYASILEKSLRTVFVKVASENFSATDRTFAEKFELIKGMLLCWKQFLPFIETPADAQTGFA